MTIPCDLVTGPMHTETLSSNSQAVGVQSSNQILQEPSQLSWDFLRSLAFPKRDKQSHDIAAAAEGTCEWLFQYEAYRSWVICDWGLLWIKGEARLREVDCAMLLAISSTPPALGPMPNLNGVVVGAPTPGCGPIRTPVKLAPYPHSRFWLWGWLQVWILYRKSAI